jgi:hypothetical protein
MTACGRHRRTELWRLSTVSRAQAHTVPPREGIWEGHETAALGMIARAEELLASAPPAATGAHRCLLAGMPRRPATHGRTATARSADLNGTHSWGDDTPLDVTESVDTGLGALLPGQRPQPRTSNGREVWVERIDERAERDLVPQLRSGSREHRQTPARRPPAKLRQQTGRAGTRLADNRED